MKTITLKKLVNYTFLAALPFVYGCGPLGFSAFSSFFGGAGIGLGSLFGGGIVGGAAAGGLFSSGGPGGGGAPGATETLAFLASTPGADTIAAIHNPEPATMLLMGGGMMAMAYSRRKQSKKR